MANISGLPVAEDPSNLEYSQFLVEIEKIDPEVVLAIKYAQIYSGGSNDQSEFESEDVGIGNITEATKVIKDFVQNNAEALALNTALVSSLQEVITASISRMYIEIQTFEDIKTLLQVTLDKIRSLEEKTKGLRLDASELKALFPDIAASIQFAEEYNLGSALSFNEPLASPNREFYQHLNSISEFLNSNGLNLAKELLGDIAMILTLCSVRINNRDARPIKNTGLILQVINKNLESLKVGDSINRDGEYNA